MQMPINQVNMLCLHPSLVHPCSPFVSSIDIQTMRIIVHQCKYRQMAILFGKSFYKLPCCQVRISFALRGKQSIDMAIEHAQKTCRDKNTILGPSLTKANGNQMTKSSLYSQYGHDKVLESTAYLLFNDNHTSSFALNFGYFTCRWYQ